MAIGVGVGGNKGVLGELPQQLRSSHPRGVLRLQHLLALYDAQEVIGIYDVRKIGKRWFRKG